jgi:hypothetical protein
MDELVSKDSSRKLLSSCVFSFVNSLYLVLHAYIQTFDEPNLVPDLILIITK